MHRRLARELPLAEDLTQETFLQSLAEAPHLPGYAAASAAGWRELAYNVFLQHLRRHRREALETSIDDVQIGTDDPDQSQRWPSSNRLLAVLGEEDQAILVMNYAFGLTNAEVGAGARACRPVP